MPCPHENSFSKNGGTWENGLLSGTRRVKHHSKYLLCWRMSDTRIFDFDTPKSAFSCVDLRILRVNWSTHEDFLTNSTTWFWILLNSFQSWDLQLRMHVVNLISPFSSLMQVNIRLLNLSFGQNNGNCQRQVCCNDATLSGWWWRRTMQLWQRRWWQGWWQHSSFWLVQCQSYSSLERTTPVSLFPCVNVKTHPKIGSKIR